MFAFYWTIWSHDSGHWFQILARFNFSLFYRFFFKNWFFFYFHHSKLSYWALSHVIFFLFFRVIPISYLRSWVSRVNLGWLGGFFTFLINYFSISPIIIKFASNLTYIVLFNCFYIKLYRSHDWATNLALLASVMFFLILF
jgi:hypothetical protein